MTVTAEPGGAEPGTNAPAVTDDTAPGDNRPPAEVALSVGGMTCAACAARVEKKLNKLPGVRASVNYATATAWVTAPAGLPVHQLTEAVEHAGYSAAARQDEQPGPAAPSFLPAACWCGRPGPAVTRNSRS
jgi:P-type Cu+ transporter